MKVFVLNGSSREHGNTEQLTNLIVDGIPSTKVHLREQRILPIADRRHTPEGFQPVADDYDAIVQSMLTHDAILFATPIYWYGMSGVMKDFVDRWSQSLRDPRYNFKEEIRDKKMYVVAVGGDAPRLKGLPLIQQFQYIFDFVGAEFAGYVIGEANKPGDILKDEQAVAQARWLNEQLKAMN
ncbi:flavodoxin family protein [Alicyclobacillus pomorum]|uniref:flavodoxin family protein n=1 Tax=Alicyclobacillus pomorum TaxID=204470 RepID=UPI00041D0F36|nr:flavodoxin family protein [Alicyclobacillus pomorum]